MSLRALLYAYVLGGLSFPPLLCLALLFLAFYSSVPASVPQAPPPPPPPPLPPHNDLPCTRKAWLTVRRAFDDPSDSSYVAFVKSYLDTRSKDPRRARPKDMWYVVLKGTVIYLYEDEAMTDCDAAIELTTHHVLVYPEDLPDGELFARRNAICLKPRPPLPDDDVSPWFIFVRSCVDMEDWYLALVHAAHHPPGTPTLDPLRPVFLPAEMNFLVATLDEQPDVIPMRWFNALLGRIFYSFYKTHLLESYIIARLMKKLSKVKRPSFLSDIAVTHFSVGDKAPTFSKPMLKELTKEGDASLELALFYKGEIRATVEATAVINLGARFKSYTVKLVLAVVLRELEGNLLVKVKRPPSSRIWYAFTKPPRMVINVEPIVSDRQITWSMILNTIEAKLEEIIIDSVVLPNMDDISFFDSADYEHRGGIWADAVRSPPPTPSQPSEHGSTSPETDTFPPDTAPIVRTTRRRSWFYSGPDTELDGEPVQERNTAPDPSPSVPSEPSDPLERDPDVQEYLRPRSSSAHSQTHPSTSRAPSLSSSQGGDDSDASPPPKSPRQILPTSTTGSFLSTLKSKAADKQALGNTAKEAMRKWGVNWGLKKDGGNSPSDGVGDMTPSYQSHRTEGTHARQNYTDMRSAVIERRERDHSERVNGTTSPIPILIPPGRSASASGGPMTAHSNGSSPGLPRSLGDVSNDLFNDRDLTEVADENALIHTQPSQARTMTIPGIHASHKGEVMSMGNVVPVSPAADTKPIGATIQSMYRLWKSPVLVGQDATTSTSPRSGDGNHDVAPLTLTPEMTPSSVRPVPPPLPPRTMPSVAVRHATESMDDEPVVSPSVSPASQALKSIASRDETRRVSMEVPVEGGSLSVEMPNARSDGKPPLPPRKITVG